MKKVMASGTFDLLHPGHGIYLQEAKNLGGYKSKQKRKRVPIVGENQRLELIKMLKPVDEAYLGNEDGDIFKIVEEIDPDIIAIGPDQTHNVEKLQKEIDKRGLKARVQRVSVYHKDELDSSCKIIKKIKNIDFEGKILDNCE